MSEAGDPNRKIFNMYFTQWWSVVNTWSKLNELKVKLDLNYFKSWHPSFPSDRFPSANICPSISVLYC